MDVVGLDVAMHDVEPVQRRNRLEQRDAKAHDFADRKMLIGIEPRLQRGAGVPGHQVIQATLVLGRHNLREERRNDTPRPPLLHQQRGGRAGIAFHRRLQGLEHQLLAVARVAHAIEQRFPRIVQDFLDDQPVEFVTDLEAMRQRQAGGAFQTVAQARRRAAPARR